mgnify:CR=1 FL=1
MKKSLLIVAALVASSAAVAQTALAAQPGHSP